MRKVKVVRIDDTREITVREVSPKMLITLFGQKENQESSGGNILGFDQTVLDNLCREGCGLSMDELAGLYGSELEQVWGAFQEVNGFFFKTAEQFGLAEIPAQIGESLTRIFGAEFAGSLKADTPTP
jgi:hypothetical protein